MPQNPKRKRREERKKKEGRERSGKIYDKHSFWGPCPL
jgi:hypothetical protein